MLLESCYSNGLLRTEVPLQKTRRDHQHAPGSAVAKDAANFALILDGAAADLGAEFAGKRPQAFIANLETDFRNSALRSEHLLGAVHAKPSQEIVGSFAKCGTEKSMEMEFGEAGFAGRLLEEDSRLIPRGQQVAPTAKPTECVVMEQVWHRGIILPFRHSDTIVDGNEAQRIKEFVGWAISVGGAEMEIGVQVSASGHLQNAGE